MFLAGGICAGLVHVLRTGEGTVVDTSLLNSAMWTLGPDMAYSSITGNEMPRMQVGKGTMSPLVGVAPHQGLALAHAEHARRGAATGRRRCRALGLPELIEQLPRRRRAPAALARAHRRCSRTRSRALTRAELEPQLREEGCIFSFFASPPEVLADPAVVENGYAMPAPHASERCASSAAPVQFDDELPTMRRGGPARGEHTVEVLAELGYDGEEIATLFADAMVDGPR